MKIPGWIAGLLLAANACAQNTPLPHGMVYGTKPDTTTMMPASKIEAFMGNRTRSSATLMGKVLKVTKSKGGWFTLDAGDGKVIKAHFKNYAINLPTAIRGKTVIIEGIATKQFVADDMQHFAGDTVIKKKKIRVKANPKKPLSFEVKGLMVYK